MKRILSAALLAMCAGTLAPASANDATVEGQIMLQTVRVTQIPSAAVPVFGDPANSNGVYFRQARCTYVLAQTATGNGADSNGLVGWVISVEEYSYDPHTFTASSDAGDIAVQYYDALGTCENQPPSTPTFEGLFDTEGDEEGAVPLGAAYAILVIEGENEANFTFTISDAA